jgi:polyhydroxyalkanoate synthesis repressor PhaR
MKQGETTAAAVPSESSEGNGRRAKVIKRYANRKLYDTERSCYVTLEEIAQMIKDGDDLQVVDNKSKDDLTAVTLAQIIVEEEKKVAKMPLQLLKNIIQSGTSSMGEAIGGFYVDRVVDPVKRIKGDVERRVDALWKRDGTKEDGTSDDVDAAAHHEPQTDAKQGIVHEFVTSTQEAFDSWQRRIDERVKETMQKHGVRPDVDALRDRVAALELRLRELEARRR